MGLRTALGLKRPYAERAGIAAAVAPTRTERHPTKADALSRIKSLGVPVGTILDVGVLGSTKDLMDAFGDRPHLLFEPLVEWNAATEVNYQNIEHEILNVAVTDHVGTVTLQSASIIPGMEISHSCIVATTEQRADLRRVPAITIDAAVNVRHLAKPFLLKVDIDGLELDVLRGAQSSLADCSVLVMEATPTNMPERLTAVHAAGFDLFDIVDLCYYDDTLYSFDMVFLNRSLLGTLEMPDITKFDEKKWCNYRH